MKRSKLIILSASFVLVMMLILVFLIFKMTHSPSKENSAFQETLQSSTLASKDGNTAKAIFQAAKARDIAKNDFERFQADHTLGMLYYNSQLLFNARESFEMAINAFPRHLQSYIYLASTYNKLGLYERTIALINNSPLSPEAMDSIALAREIPEGLKINTYLIIATAYKGTKDYTNALKYFKKAKNEGAKIDTSFLNNLRALSSTQEKLPVADFMTDPWVKTSMEYTTSPQGTINFALDDLESLTASWSDAEIKYPEGSTVTGTIVNVSLSGITVRLKNSSLQGIVSPDNARWGKTDDLRKYFYPGERVQATVLKIDKAEQLLSLGIKQLTAMDPPESPEDSEEYLSQIEKLISSYQSEGTPTPYLAEIPEYTDPDDSWEKAKNAYSEGSIVTGTIINVSSSGITIRLKGSDLRGDILPDNIPGNTDPVALRDRFYPGTQITAVVLRIDQDKKILFLGLKQLKDNTGNDTNAE